MFPLRALRVVRIAACSLPVETKALLGVQHERQLVSRNFANGRKYLAGGWQLRKVESLGGGVKAIGRTHRGKSQGGDFRFYCWDLKTNRAMV